MKERVVLAAVLLVVGSGGNLVHSRFEARAGDFCFRIKRSLARRRAGARMGG
ncbi:MAG: hypothetical protein FJY73_07195 [Candidatus Eisenbacteria bacterium]|nr:hypothetical protein [Candidatus Eisenbacteria bacterium]